MATKIVTKNSSTASAVPTASDLVQGELAVNVADKRLFTEDNAGAIVELGTNPSGNVTFQDNGKAIFGAGDDLQIYHDGSNSYINDAGTGNLYLRASNAIIMQSADGAETLASFHDDNLCRLYFDNAIKLATTSTGIDVTGTATMDGLTVDGDNQYNKISSYFSGSYISGFKFSDLNGGIWYDAGTDDLTVSASHANSQLVLESGGSETVRLDASGNVGIGTSSPSSSLDIVGDVKSSGNLNVGGNTLVNQASADNTYLKVNSSSSGDGGILLQRANANKWQIASNTSHHLVLDSLGGGNVLIPTGNALVGRTSSLSSQSGSVSANTVVSAHGPLSSHATNAGILEYYNDETLLRSYGANAGSGELVFKTGGGGGSADSEAMRITSDGKVGIGNSDPKRALVVAASDSAGVQTQYVNTTTGSALGDGFTVGINASEQAEFWNAENTAMLFATNNTERMRIDSAGAISVGSSTQAVTELQLNHENSGGKGELQLNAHGSASFSMLSNFTGSTVNGVATGGFGLITPHSYPISIVTNNLERMRIDSSGNLLVGCSALPSGGAGGAGFEAGQSGGRTILQLGTTVTSSEAVARFYNPNGSIGSISLSGSSTTYNTSSDQRLKENIADADDAGSKIDAIQVRKFDWKADGSHQDYGMVAQELQTVAPEAVSGDADSEDMMGVDYSKLVPMLIKEIQSLRNRVAQLEE